MSVAGFQEYWAVGSRLYFKPDAVGGVAQPWTDLGTIATVSPAFATEKIELEDGDGGVRQLVASSTTKITETYDLVLSNLSDPNLAFGFLANPPESFVQVNEDDIVTNFASPGHITKILDDDGVPLFALTAICGVYVGAGTIVGTTNVTGIDASTRTLTVSADLTTLLDPGDQVVVMGEGLADPANAGTYTIESMTATTIVTVEPLSSDEAGVTVQLLHDSGTNGFVAPANLEVVSLDRGIVRIGAAEVFTPGDFEFYITKGAVTGNRLVHPQTREGQIEGLACLVWGRDGNADQTARYMRVQLAPSAADFKVDGYSTMTLQATVIKDANAVDQLGALVHFKGTMPSAS